MSFSRCDVWRTGRHQKISSDWWRVFAHSVDNNVNKLIHEKNGTSRYLLSSSVHPLNLHQVGTGAEVRVLELCQEVIAKTSSGEEKQELLISADRFKQRAKRFKQPRKALAIDKRVLGVA